MAFSLFRRYHSYKSFNGWLLFDRFTENAYGLFIYISLTLIKSINTLQQTLQFSIIIKKECQGRKEATLKKELKSVSGVSIDTEIVFIRALQYCKQKLLKRLQQCAITAEENTIQWVIVVPDIWSEEARGLMQQWAIRANLWDPSISNQLLLASENECRNMFVISELNHGRNTKPLKKGDCYVLMDFGEAISDVACYQVSGQFEVKEITTLRIPWKFSCIDQDIMNIIEQICGKKTVQDFQVETPECYAKLLNNITKSRKGFFIHKKTNGIHRIEIPFEFVHFMDKRVTGDLSDL
ncbi:hypothetical protein RFI_25714, partial [Reticulomyxa filosa]